MAVYSCECGLIVSTSSVRPRCLRCLRVLSVNNLSDWQATAPLTPGDERPEGRPTYCQATLGIQLNVRPVLVPVTGSMG